MKIAIISMIRESWGGSEELWFEMAKSALDQGHTIIHLSFDFETLHPRLRELQTKGAVLYRRPGYYPPRFSPRQKTVRMMINFVKKKVWNPFNQIFHHRPDIVLYNGTWYSISKEKLLLKALESNRVVFYILGQLNNENERGFNEQEKSTIVAAYKRSKKIFFVSNRNKETAERHLCMDVSNADLVRNPVNMSETGLLPFPSDCKPSLAMVGNLLTVHKGQDILLSVLRMAKWQERDWVLNIYGEGSDKEYLQQLAAYFGLQGRVIFHGSVADIKNIWKTNHILLMPSRMEGMPLAIVEAMLCGRPCVATDVGGAGEWIEDGISGFLAEAASTQSFDKALERAWQEKDRWESIGRSAHERAQTLYDPAAGKTLLEKMTRL